MKNSNVKTFLSYSILFLLINVTFYAFWINPRKNPEWLLQYDGVMAVFFPCIFICLLFGMALCIFKSSNSNRDFICEVILFPCIIFLSFNFITLYNGNFIQTTEKLLLQIIHSRFTGIQIVAISSLYAVFLACFTKYARLFLFLCSFLLACVDYGKRCFFNDHLYIHDFYLADKDFLEVVVPFAKEYTDMTIIFIFCALFLYSIKKSNIYIYID